MKPKFDTEAYWCLIAGITWGMTGGNLMAQWHEYGWIEIVALIIVYLACIIRSEVCAQRDKQ